MGIRVGIIGAGNIAVSRHFPTYQNSDRAQVSGIYDNDIQKTRSVADEWDITAMSNLGELFSKADLISICTPPSKHCEQAVNALNNGCHVLTEKPMAMSTAEADKMINAAEENDRILSVVHNFQFMKRMRSALELQETGQLGNVNRTFAVLLKNKQQGKAYLSGDEGGWSGMRFWDEAPHMMYLTRAFIGDMELDNAEATTDESGTAYRTLRTQFEGTTGATGTVSFVWDSPITEWWLVVVGTQGIVFIDIFRDLLVEFNREKAHSAVRVISVLSSAIGQLAAGGFRSGVQHIHDRIVRGYRIPDSGFSDQVGRVLTAISEGSEPPITGKESKRILEHMEAVAGDAGLTERN